MGWATNQIEAISKMNNMDQIKVDGISTPLVSTTQITLRWTYFIRKQNGKHI